MAPITRSRTRGVGVTPQQNKSTSLLGPSIITSKKKKKYDILPKKKTEQCSSTLAKKGTTSTMTTPPPHPPSSHLKLAIVARMYLVEAEEYVGKAEG